MKNKDERNIDITGEMKSDGSIDSLNCSFFIVYL